MYRPMDLKRAFERARPYLLNALLPALKRDRFAFSEIGGWHITAASPGEAGQAVEALLEEELWPFVTKVCSEPPAKKEVLPGPYEVAGFVAFLGICEEDGLGLLAKGCVGFDLDRLVEAKGQIAEFYRSCSCEPARLGGADRSFLPETLLCVAAGSLSC